MQDEVLDFIADNSHAVLSTTRRDGRPQLSPVDVTVNADGQVVLSSRTFSCDILSRIVKMHL